MTMIDTTTTTTTTTTYSTREEWLNAAVTHLTPLFTDRGFQLPTVSVSCGWPSVGGARKTGRRIGECWTSSAADGTNHVFISPLIGNVLVELDEDDMPMQGVLETLVHELCHAVDDCQSDHGPAFLKIARSMGLEGKATATYAGDELNEELKDIAEELGPYPHSPISLTFERTKTQTTRMKKVICDDCGYTVRTTMKWIKVGMPTCPCGTEMVLEEGQVDDENGGE